VTIRIAARAMVADVWLASYHEIGYGHGYLQTR
jgi:hypothetical protein